MRGAGKRNAEMTTPPNKEMTMTHLTAYNPNPRVPRINHGISSCLDVSNPFACAMSDERFNHARCTYNVIYACWRDSFAEHGEESESDGDAIDLRMSECREWRIEDPRDPYMPR